MTPSGSGSQDRALEDYQDVLLNPQGSVVIIVEHPGDVPSLRRIRESVVARILVVASSPAVAWELEKLEIPFRAIDAYCDRQAVVNLGMDNFQTVQELCDLIDRELETRFPFLRELQLRPAGDNYLYFKMLYDGLSLRREILGALLDREDPDLLLSMEGVPGNEGPGDPVMPFAPGEHPYHTTLSSPGWSCRKGVVKVHPPDHYDGGKGRAGITDGIRAALLRSSTFYNLAFTRKRYGSRRSLRLLSDMARNWARGGDRLLFTGYTYNWHYLIPELYSRGFQVTHLSLPAPMGGFDVREAKINETLVQSRCRLKGVDFSSAFVARANPVLSKAIMDAEIHSPHISRKLETVNPRAVLCGPRPRFLDNLPGRIARHRGIPVLSWQHGAQGINRAPIMLYVEAMGSDYHLCFGKGVREEFAEEARNRFSCDLRSVGSYELEELTRVQPSAKSEFSVLYATTNYYESNFYISAPSVLLDLELWETQRAILDLLGRSGRKTAFKLHPGSYGGKNLLEYLEIRGYRNILAFKRERSFPDLLQCSDLVVLDFPSTVLLQSVAAGKPVFVLTKHLQLTDKASATLARRAWCTEDLTAFLAQLEEYLRGDASAPQPDIGDTQFLTEYGVHILDGKVAGRAEEVIREAMGRISPPAG